MGARVSGLFVAVLVMFSVPLSAEEPSGGSKGCGDAFGDLVHVLRDAATGQPILQKRWVELPGSAPGYGWGYCPVAVDGDGNELPFLELSCDVDPAFEDAVVELDYFGRLNGGRTKERNNRMHFNEVIASIKDAEMVRQDETGRLKLGYDCELNPQGSPVRCDEWSVVDSPMESLGLYTRLTKYGHIQTDPLEEDPWFHGDPALPTQYHPALGPEDWVKFAEPLRHLLPEDFEPEDCFHADGTFNTACAGREPLDENDFVRAGSFLAGAANKHGRITVHLVQYVNRILKIPVDTDHTLAPLDILPAQIRDCPATGVFDPDGEEQQEPSYDMDSCIIYDADPGLEHYDLFYEVREYFVDFGAATYDRTAIRSETLEVIQHDELEDAWRAQPVELVSWLDHQNAAPGSSLQIDAFVRAAEDALRSIEFIHNYAIPLHLW